MTPEQKIKKEILLEAISREDSINFEGELTAQNIDDVYVELLISNDLHWDYENEFREGLVETEIPCDVLSRHYESKSVASRLKDGSWVGWTYWYGGGKHGEPEAIDWMRYAYDLKCMETKEMVLVRKFEKVDASKE